MTDVDLLGVARQVAGDARAGEQVEAYVLRSRDVDVKVFGGEVESLAVAEVEGVGVRVIVGARQGYAWAGSLDPDVISDTVAEARDNAAFGAPDESYALASPEDATGVDVPVLDLWRDDVLGVTTAEKVALALELEAATLARRPARARGGVGFVRRRRGRGRDRQFARARSRDPPHGVLVLGVRHGRRGNRDPDR